MPFLKFKPKVIATSSQNRKAADLSFILTWDIVKIYVRNACCKYEL